MFKIKYETKEVKFNVGQLILLKVEKKDNELALQYTGPYKILQQIPPLNFEIEIRRHSKWIGDVDHVSLIKPYAFTN